MSKYCFAVHMGQFGAKLKGGLKAARKRDKIAKAIARDAGYVYYYAEGEKRWYGHGYCKNLGPPFDAATARAIAEAWAVAGV
jgi:hypothetical protein